MGSWGGSLYRNTLLSPQSRDNTKFVEIPTMGTIAQHAIEMFRRSLPAGPPRHRLDQLSNRLTKILSETRKLNPAG